MEIEGNKIWYNRALVYFHRSESAGRFCMEFNFIRKELGIIKPYKPKNKDEEIGNVQNAENI